MYKMKVLGYIVALYDERIDIFPDEKKSDVIFLNLGISSFESTYASTYKWSRKTEIGL